MKKKIIIIGIVTVLILIVGLFSYKKFYNPNPTEKEILEGVDAKNKIRNELNNVIQGKADADENYQISISEARSKAIIIFNSLGESNLDKDNVNVREIERNGNKYYYVSSLENTMEVEINTGKVTKINNVAQ